MVKISKKRSIDEFEKDNEKDIMIQGNEFNTLSKYIKDTTTIFSVSIINNNVITSIPDVFPNVYEIRLFDSFVERILCNSVRYIHIEKNYELRYINDIKNLRTICAKQCMNLFEINNRSVHLIDISNCVKLEKINNTIKLENLTAYHCPKLYDMGTMINLKSIRLSKCHSICQLSDFPNVTHIFISDCNECTTISNMANIRYLEIINCPKMLSVHSISHIENMYISDCPMFNQLTDISSISSLIVSASPLVHIHTIPISNITIRNITESVIDMKINELTNMNIVNCANVLEIHIHSFGFKKIEIDNCKQLSSIHIQNKYTTELIELVLKGDMEYKKISSNCHFKMNIVDNAKLRELKNSDNLEELYIDNCARLFSIYELNTIKRLSVTNCCSMKIITSIPYVQYLQLKNCYSLERIVCSTEHLRVVNIVNCTELTYTIESDVITHITLQNGGIILFNSSFDQLRQVHMINAPYYNTIDSKKVFYEKYYAMLKSIPIIQRTIRLSIIKKYKNKPCVAQNHTMCSICLSSFDEDKTKKILSCFHVFHSKCLKMWHKESKTCPMCKNPCL